MELAKNYDPKELENKWYQVWENSGYFKPNFKDGAPNYCIQLPPPNVTGTLHMGHGFQHTLQDSLIRYHRMRGFNTLWQAGTDHAGIATQIVVERELEATGKSRYDLTREEFIERVWQWKEISGNTITNQMRRLGASCDWTRERFTMDKELCLAVNKVFIDLFKKGLIYRGKRLVNWDVKLKTAVSDLEVMSTEENGSLWHIRYPIKDSNESIVIATTRPETMLGDVAIAVNPNDGRHSHLIGKFALLPLTDREIPIVADEYVDIEFGTGCVKITPAHDFNDYEVAKRHNLPMISIMNLEGYINEFAPDKYKGLERFAARKQIIADLEKLSLLVDTKPHKLMVPRGDRTNVVIEPMLTDQWFVSMDGLAKNALKIVETGETKFVPENWTATYNQWLNNIQDWCISRQLWWGHRIPAYYDENGKYYVAESFEEAVKQAGTNNLKQDDDVLDTWFSSALWSFSTLGWPQKTKELEHFLPSNVLVTGFDIIFFWVARMIMFTCEFTGEVPFKEVCVTGLIQDAQGNKMSKSKGNIIDPLDLVDGIDIETLVTKRTRHLMNPKLSDTIANQTRKDYPDGFQAFGADALRFTFAALATQGREIRFDVKRIEGSKNFCNKLWNATRFVLMNLENHKDLLNQDIYLKDLGLIDKWILISLQNLINDTGFAYKTYRFDLLAQKLYEFVWNEFCDWYLELAKVNLQGEDKTVRAATAVTLVKVLDQILRLLHPIMPFITEELWHGVKHLNKNADSETIMLAKYPETISEFSRDQELINQEVAFLKDIVGSIRNLRAEMNLNPAQKTPLIISGVNDRKIDELLPYIKSLAKVSEIKIVEKVESTLAPIALVGALSLMLEVEIDFEVEKSRLNREIEKNTKELEKIKVKLDNPAFIERAPKNLVERDIAKLAELSDIIAKLNSQLSQLK